MNWKITWIVLLAGLGLMWLFSGWNWARTGKERYKDRAITQIVLGILLLAIAGGLAL